MNNLINRLYKNIAKLALVLTVLICQTTFTESYAQQMDVCEAGLTACKGLQDDSKKYSKCMFILCADAEKAERRIASKIKQCETGYRKCNILRDEPLYYWTCVDDTCSNPPERKPDPSCQDGHNQCQPKINQYWTCMSATCNTIFSQYKVCPVGEDECAYHLTDYWNCVTETCLGKIHKYRNPKLYQDKKHNHVAKYLDELNIPTTPPYYAAPPIRGGFEGQEYAPQGINPYDWGSAITPPSRQLRGSASARFTCETMQASISCQTDDISSCICSDGSSPYNRTTIQDIIDERDKKAYEAEIRMRTPRKPLNNQQRGRKRGRTLGRRR